VPFRVEYFEAHAAGFWLGRLAFGNVSAWCWPIAIESWTSLASVTSFWNSDPRVHGYFRG